MAEVPTVQLNNGVLIPQLGLGVWRAEDGDEVEQAIGAALKTGYRLLDTAAIYRNEAGVGRAIKASGVPREEIFITTKLWNSDQGYDAALKAFDVSLDKLGLDYLDLYLIHWPLPARNTVPDTWRALEKLLADKRVRAIGVCNFKPAHLENLLDTAVVVPAVNQIELHPKFQQHATREMCAKHGIRVESWSPLMQGGEVLNDPIITEIAQLHHKTPAQVVIRWHLQNDLIVIPKSVHAERIAENFNVFDFELSDEQIARINNMDVGKRIGPDPDNSNFT
jgi:diketogulonate reductase-like aldo/keto reductase